MALSLRSGARQMGLAAVAVALSVALLVFGRGAAKPAERRVRVQTTVVPGDRVGLQCSSRQCLGDECCGFNEGQPTGRPEPLQPFVTLEEETVLLSHVFSAPEVADWLRSVGTTGAADRVAVDCEIVVTGTMDRVGIRFGPNDTFDSRDGLRAGRAVTCSVRR